MTTELKQQSEQKQQDGTQQASPLAAAGAGQQGTPTSTTTNQQSKTAEQIAAEAAQAKAKPEGLDDAFWDAATGTVKTDDVIKSLSELKSAEAERAKTIGTKPEDYQFTVDPSLKGPDGNPIKIDEASAQALREFAVANKLPIPVANQVLNMAAKRDLERFQAETASFNAVVTAEKAKLGADADKRIGALSTAMKARFGDKAIPFINLSSMSAVAVEVLEDIVRTTGAPAYNGGSGGGTQTPDMASMSVEERLHYTRNLQQAKGKAA